jgi:hypothetical protein
MNRSNFLRGVLLVACLLLGGCQTMRRADPVAGPPHGWRGALIGEFDNHEQVEQAKPSSLPSVRFTGLAMTQPEWIAWRTRLRGTSTLEASWLLRIDTSADGRVLLTPHRPLVADAATDAKFDAAQWVALDACALRAEANATDLVARADVASCATVAPGIGVEAALLPLLIEQHGDVVSVRLYADQARGADARAEARRVQWYAGWAAINGAGANATADSGDWHMSKNLRIDNEGGRVALAWRDGKPSGHSLRLERLTYRDGSTPVLKLSLIEDAGDHAVAYAWANPEATSIGINLGWVQVGLTRDAASAK